MVLINVPPMTPSGLFDEMDALTGIALCLLILMEVTCIRYSPCWVTVNGV